MRVGENLNGRGKGKLAKTLKVYWNLEEKKTEEKSWEAHLKEKKWGTQIDRERERGGGGETDGQTARQTNRQSQRQRHRQTDREVERER